MFELPDAKRVRREDIFNDGDSTRQSSPDLEEEAAIQAKLRAQLSDLIAVDIGSPTGDTKVSEPDEKDEGVPEDQDQHDVEPEFEFRLFSSAAPQKIVLAPTDTGKIDENSGGIVEPRPLSYYIRGELSAQQREQFAAAAITAADILQGAKQRAWGLEVPWRVTKITICPSSSSSPSSGSQKGGKQVGRDGVVVKKKKGKLGKKARIAARTKQKALLELEKQKMTKEEHLKEKKKRLNREKKLKRRQKEKEKKAAAAGGAGTTGTGEMKGDGDGDESMSEGEN